MTEKSPSEELLEQNLKWLLVDPIENPSGSPTFEVEGEFDMADVIARLQSEGIVDARPTLVRKFDLLVAPRRSEKGAARGKYRAYDRSDVAMLKLFLALYSLGFNKKQVARFWEHYKVLVKEILKDVPPSAVLTRPLKELLGDLSNPQIQEKVKRLAYLLREIRLFQHEVAERAAKVKQLTESAPRWVESLTAIWAVQTEEIGDAMTAIQKGASASNQMQHTVLQSSQKQRRGKPRWKIINKGKLQT